MTNEAPSTNEFGRARHSVRAVGRFIEGGAHGETRPTFSFVIALLLLTLLNQLSTSPAHAQYSIGWFVFQGGGGESETVGGSPYSVNGTFGASHGTPPATGGAYAVTGNFFAHETRLVTIPQPSLTVTRNADGSATVSWPILSTGYVVQQSSTLTVGNWTPAPYGINHNGVIRWFTIQPTSTSLFFRLHKP